MKYAMIGLAVIMAVMPVYATENYVRCSLEFPSTVTSYQMSNCINDISHRLAIPPNEWHIYPTVFNYQCSVSVYTDSMVFDPELWRAVFDEYYMQMMLTDYYLSTYVMVNEFELYPQSRITRPQRIRTD